MAKIVITHFSGIYFNDQYQSSCFYDGLIKGFNECGHDVLQVITSDFLHRPWNGTNTVFDSELETMIIAKIKSFTPDLVISFNNSSIRGLEDAVSCPIALWDADSFQFFNDKETIRRKSDRYSYMSFSQHGVQDYKNKLNIHEYQVCRIPAATAVISQNLSKKYNINFIGNLFPNPDTLYNLFKKHPNLIGHSIKSEKHLDQKLLKLLNQYAINPSVFIHYESGEKRAKLIYHLLDLGIKIFGPSDWLQLAKSASNIINAYDDSKVFSLKHNELVYNRSIVSLNICHTQNITSYPWRTCDILASSSLLLSEYKSDLEQDFKPYINFEFYNSCAEAYDIAKSFINDPEKRKDIIFQQNNAIEENFRWQHRFPLMQQLTGVDLSPVKQYTGNHERYTVMDHWKEIGVIDNLIINSIRIVHGEKKINPVLNISFKNLIKQKILKLLKRKLSARLHFLYSQSRAKKNLLNNEYQ